MINGICCHELLDIFIELNSIGFAIISWNQLLRRHDLLRSQVQIIWWITYWDSVLISLVEIGCWNCLCLIQIVRGCWVGGKCKPKSGAWAGEGGMQGWVGEWGGARWYEEHMFSSCCYWMPAACMRATRPLLEATRAGNAAVAVCQKQQSNDIFTMYASKLQHTMNSLDPYGRKARKQHADF